MFSRAAARSFVSQRWHTGGLRQDGRLVLCCLHNVIKEGVSVELVKIVDCKIFLLLLLENNFRKPGTIGLAFLGGRGGGEMTSGCRF